jgi:hypothetical protein
MEVKKTGDQWLRQSLRPAAALLCTAVVATAAALTNRDSNAETVSARPVPVL